MDSQPLMFSETQYDLVQICIDAWRLGSFWSILYMQSRMFDGDNAKSMEEELSTIPKPVSYTHLDVYKRQLPGPELTRSGPISPSLSAFEPTQRLRILLSHVKMEYPLIKTGVLPPHPTAQAGSA